MGTLAALGYNVDALAACGGGSLVAGLSNFVGPHWTGGVAVLSVAPDGGAPQVQSLLERRSGVAAVACLPTADEFTGRRIVATGGDDGSVDLFYLSSSGGGGSSSGSKAPRLEHAQSKVLHDACVSSLAAAPTCNQLASGSADGSLRLWDCSQLLACTGQLGGGGGAAVHAVAWTADSSVLASAANDGAVRLWDTRQVGAAPAAAAAVGVPAVSVVAAAAAGGQQQQQQLLVVGDQLGRVTVFDARQLSQPLQQRQLHGDAVHALASSSGSSSGGGSSSMVASGSDDGSILLLDCASLAASRQLAPPRQEGEAPCYIRALAWTAASSGGGGSSGGAGQQQQQQQRPQLYRGGWDQLVSHVPI